MSVISVPQAFNEDELCVDLRSIFGRSLFLKCEGFNFAGSVKLKAATEMVEAADRMKAMRERRRARGLRELRLIVPDARSKSVRRRVAREVAALDRSREIDALNWIEAVSEFDDR